MSYEELRSDSGVGTGVSGASSEPDTGPASGIHNWIIHSPCYQLVPSLC